MEVEPLADATTFSAVAAPVLDRDRAANNLALGVLQVLLDRPGDYREAYFWIVRRGADVLAAALRTPPYNLVFADPLDPGSVDVLARTLVSSHPDLPGVTANEPWATRFAGAWISATHATARTSIGQGVYAISAVRAPRPATGASRPAIAEDRPLLERWLTEFEHEALQAMTRDERGTERAIAARLEGGDTAGFSIWEDQGRAVSLTGWARIPGGARIGPVYTPPSDRGRGYASNLVAHVSGEMLSRGAEACFLFTDLGNPTSNAIYRRIGYDQIAESLMIVFEEPNA
ncbi:MAG: GNAT family N-acetyltransferase [Actinomycetota bacterium]